MRLFKARYIAACIDEIKQELRQDSVYVKANAIEKLCYVSSTFFPLFLLHILLNIPNGFNKKIKLNNEGSRFTQTTK